MTRSTKKNRIWFMGMSLFFCTLIYSCLQDDQLVQEEGSETLVTGNNKELTVTAAQQWFEANNKPVVAVRSISKDENEILLKPKWAESKESRQSNFEVVETTILVNKKNIFMDSETKERFNAKTDSKRVRNIARMVVIKNLETGKICNFIMIFVGTYDYLKTTRTLGKNSYLHREPDFDGSVYFYKPGGTFVNGWKYKAGKIVARISPGTEEGYKLSTTRTIQQSCSGEVIWITEYECYGDVFYNEEFGEIGGVTCVPNTHAEYYETCTTYDDGVTENTESWIPEEGSGGSGGYQPPTKPEKESEVDKLLKDLYGPGTTLTEAQKKLLNEAIATLKKDYPALYNAFKSLASIGIKIDFVIDSSLKSGAQYSTHRIIRFQTNGDINYYELREELIHAVQHNEFYKDKMNGPCDINIELEAKLMCELSQAFHDGGKFNPNLSNILIGASDELKKATEELVRSVIAQGGFTQNQQELYQKVGELASNEWGYKYQGATFDPSFLPEVLYKYLKTEK